jgi:hypothetical protein
MDTECALNFSLHIVLVLHLFAFIPVASIHQFLIYALTFSVQRPLAGYTILYYSIISCGNIILDLCLFDLCPLSQEHN